MKLGKYYVNYYRMTGYSYKLSLKSIVNRLFFQNLAFMYRFRKYEMKHRLIDRIFLKRLTKDMDWRYLKMQLEVMLIFDWRIEYDS